MPSDPDAEISCLFTLLHKWGIHSLGQLAALNREELAARLGPLAGQLWDQAAGKSQRLLRLVRPPEIFSEQLEFEYEIETTEPLLFVLRRFLDQLALRLQAAYLVAHELRFQLTFADKSDYEHVFQIPEPTISMEILFRLLQTHLENFRAEHPIIAVALTIQPVAGARQQFDLFETPLRDPNRLHETLNRLTGLLGAERVGTPVREDSHWPDAFHPTFSWQLPKPPNESSPNEQTLLRGPTLRRLREETRAAPDAEIVARKGPYLSSGDWWDEKRWASAEWDLQLASGDFCRAQKHAQHWQFEAFYD